MPSRDAFDDEDFTEEDAIQETADYDRMREKEMGYPSVMRLDLEEVDQVVESLQAHDDNERGWQDFIAADEVEEFRDFFEDYLGDVDASGAVDEDWRVESSRQLLVAGSEQEDRGPVVARRMGHPMYASDFGEDEPF